MATLSMTGFGRGSAVANGFRAKAELSSVNRKQFDASVALPAPLACLEDRCRTIVHGALTRGHAQLTVRVASADAAAAAPIDADAVRAKMAQLRALAEVADVPMDISIADLARMPELMAAGNPFPDPEAVWPAVEGAVRAAVESHSAMRTHEGLALRADLETRISAMRALRDKIAVRAPLVPVAYRDALRRRVADLGAPLGEDDPTLAREVAVLADRCDIAEELTRLSAHFDHAIALFDGAEPSGRKLDFLAQEMNRESNTIGSKANDTDITACVIDLKALVETFREQVQNLE